MDEIVVTGIGQLKKLLGKNKTISPGQTVGEAVANLKLGEAGGLPITPMVNDRVVEWSYTLQPGDRLVLAPTIGGGCWISK